MGLKIEEARESKRGMQRERETNGMFLSRGCSGRIDKNKEKKGKGRPEGKKKKTTGPKKFWTTPLYLVLIGLGCYNQSCDGVGV